MYKHTTAPDIAMREKATLLRDEVFGRKAIVRAVIEFSNYCRQNCSYCGMRRSNQKLSRNRLLKDDIRRLVYDHLPRSVTDISFQAGEDPKAVEEILLPLVDEFSRNLPHGITLCLGNLPRNSLEQLYQAGARYYILKMESANAEHFHDIRAPGGRLAKRIEVIRTLKEVGFHVSSGIIYGLPGQTDNMVEEFFDLLTQLPLSGASVSPFIAGDMTPFNNQPNADIVATQNCLAALRVKFPRYIIPAVSAYSILDPEGYVNALRFASNLVTINMTPEHDREGYPIYRSKRTIMHEQRVLRALDEADMTPSAEGLLSYLDILSGTQRTHSLPM